MNYTAFWCLSGRLATRNHWNFLFSGSSMFTQFLESNPCFCSSQPQEATTGRAATSCWAAIAARDPSAHSKISELRGRFAGKKWEDHLPMGDLHCHLWLQDITKIQKKWGLDGFGMVLSFPIRLLNLLQHFPFQPSLGFLDDRYLTSVTASPQGSQAFTSSNADSNWFAQESKFLGRHQDMVLWKRKCKLKPLYGSVVLNYAAASSAISMRAYFGNWANTHKPKDMCRNDSLESAGNEGRFWKKRLASFLGACFYWGPIYFNIFFPWLEGLWGGLCRFGRCPAMPLASGPVFKFWSHAPHRGMVRDERLSRNTQHLDGFGSLLGIGKSANGLVSNRFKARLDSFGIYRIQTQQPSIWML